MPLNKLTLKLASSSWRILALLAVVIGTSALTMIAVAFGAGTGPDAAGGIASTFALFSHPPATGAATLAGLTPPAGATLAVESSNNTVYGWQPTSADVCVIDLQTSGIGGEACAHRLDAETRGVVLTLRPAAALSGARLTVAALVPNGVKEVTFSTRDGSASTAPVDNNVAVLSDANLASVRYTLPDGGQYVQQVPDASAAAASGVRGSG